MNVFDEMIGAALSKTMADAQRLEEQLDALREQYNAELAARVQAERERDEARERLARARNTILERSAEIVHLLGELRAVCRWGWVVARDGGRYCERCEQEIRRGEAFDIQPGTGGLMVHIHCPNGEFTDA